MIKQAGYLLASTLAFLATFSPASADNVGTRGDYLTVYTGNFNLLDDDDHAAQFGLEYRAEEIGYNFVPIVGANVTTDGALYGYVGLNFDWEFTDGMALIPNFAVGAFEEGSGKDLGGTLEFRSGLELAYEFSDNSRVGVAFNHISNASIYDHNPGAETLLVNYSIPLSHWFK